MKDLSTSANFPVQYRHSVKSAFFTVAITAVFSMGGPVWCQAIDNVQQDYRTGNYVQLLTDCDKALAKDPNNAVIHYYRATAWSKMGVANQAEAEYKTAFRLTRDPHVQQYCRAALAAFQNPSSQANTAAIGVQAGRATLPNGAGTLPPSLIEQQADSLSLAALDQAAAAHTAYNHATQQADVLKKQADANANAMASQIRYDKYHNAYPVYTPEQIAAARQQGYDNAADLITRSKIQSDSAYETAKLKAYETQASAAALLSQLQAGPKGSVHLLEHGTNFFVRNYGTDPTPSSINPAQAHVGDDPPLAATQKTLPEWSRPGSHGVANGQGGVTTNVQGRLLKSKNQ